jgi:hypothetical protein
MRIAAVPLLLIFFSTTAHSEETRKGFFQQPVGRGELILSGRIHWVLMQVDDGAEQNHFFMDSDQAPTMLRADFRTATDKGWTLSGALEVRLQNNRSFFVSQDESNPDPDVWLGEADIDLENENIGKFSVGRGFSAAWIAPELDLSGTVPAALLAVGNLAPGMKFVETDSGQLSDIKVFEHFVDTERLLLVDRFRYDSPRFGNGAQVSGTIAEDSRWDVALRYYPALAAWTLRAAAAYLHKPYLELDDRIELGVSVRHNDTGLSLTTVVAYGNRKDGETATGYVGKIGWLTKLSSLGHTAFSLDYARNNDARLLGDSGKSVGLFVYQKWDKVRLDFYAGYRYYDVKRPDIKLNLMDIFVLGGIFSF